MRERKRQPIKKQSGYKQHRFTRGGNPAASFLLANNGTNTFSFYYIIRIRTRSARGYCLIKKCKKIVRRYLYHGESWKRYGSSRGAAGI